MKYKNRRLTVEIRGVGFVNKGAELMLQSIKRKLAEFDPSISIAMEVNCGIGLKKSRVLFNKIRKNGLLVKPSGRRWKINIADICSLIPKATRLKNGIVIEKEIDVIIDSSGFAFGDQWSVPFMQKRLTNKIEKWKSQGKRIILLPQAFGPFSNDEVKNEMRKIHKFADVIFVRDKISYENVINLTGKDEKISLYPDFTNLLACKAPDDFDPSTYQVAIIPNFKMGKVAGGIEQYKQLLQKSIEIIQAKRFHPFFLIHEGKGDEDIADDINLELAVKIPTIKGKSAEEIKGIIGKSHAVVTSRFHGLVSALSQGVPCLSTSWSHKYKMLLDNYDYKEGLIDNLAIDLEDLTAKLEMILSPVSGASIKSKLLTMSDAQKELSNEMWAKVFSVLDVNS